MADFKTHISIGAFTGFFISVITFALEWVHNFAIAILMFFITIIGSFLPDSDSDSGLPIQIIFGLYSFVAAGFAMYVVYNNDFHKGLLFVAPVAAFALVKYVFEPQFKKVTSHRGIFHSVPAVFISFFATLLIANLLRLTTLEKFVFAIAISAGYLSHLVLDEIYSTSILEGKLKIKRSFGTALDLGFKQKKQAIIAYVILIALIYFSIPILKGIINKLGF